MGVFDRYRQTNSSQINRYAGAPVEEMAKVGMHLQGQYDVNKDQLDVIGRTMRSSPVLSQDREFLNKELESVRSGLSGAVEKGNYEDMSHQVRTLGRDFSERYSPFAKNYGLYMERLKEIEDNKDISASTKELLKQEAGDYKGLSRGKDGTIGGFFSGHSIAKDVNMDEFTRKALEGMMAHSTGSEGFTIGSAGGGEYFMESGGKRTTISPERVRAAVSQAAALNPEVESYLRQKARLSTRGFEKITYEQAVKSGGAQGSAIAEQAKELATSQNVSFGQAYKHLAQQSMVTGILGTAAEYGVNSKAYDNIETFNRAGKETAGSQESRATRLAALKNIPEDRFVLPGGLRGGGEQQSPNDVYRDVGKLSENITTLERQLKNPQLDPADREDIESRLLGAKHEKTRNKQFLRRAADEITGKLPETVEAEIVGRTAGVQTSSKPVKLTRAMLASAMENGNYSNRGGSLSIKLPDGREAVIRRDVIGSTLRAGIGLTSNMMSSGQGKAGMGAMSQAIKVAGPGNKPGAVFDAFSDFKGLINERSKTGSYSANQVSMTSSERKDIKDLYSGAQGAFDVFSEASPGSPLKDSKKPQGIDFSTFEPVTEGGQVILRGQALDEKGKATGEMIYLKPKPGNNVGEVLATKLMKESKGKTSTTNSRMASSLMNPVIEDVTSLQPGQSSNAGNGVKIQLHQTPNGKKVYKFIDPSGNEVKENNGSYLYETTAEGAYARAMSINPTK